MGDAGFWRDILLRLPAESLFRFRAVCQQWRTIINYPGFVKAHTIYQQLSSNAGSIILRNSTGPPFSPLYYFNLQDLNFYSNHPQTIPVVPLNLTRGGLSSLRSLPVAACNGLLLTAPRYDAEGDWEIRNPLTQERLKLPKPNIDTNSEVVGYGLGYDSAADDYKVFVIDYFLLNSTSRTLVHVYSLKSDSWKKIGNCPFNLPNTNLLQRGVFLNGALHWLSSDDDGILVLDVGTESYRYLAIPDLERSQESTTQLEALSGCLFMTHCYVKNDQYGNRIKRCTDVWFLSYDGGKENLWLKWLKLEFFASLNGYGVGDLRPVAYLKNKRRVFLQDGHQIFWFDLEQDGHQIFWFHLERNIKKVNIHAVCSENSIISAQAFVGSLFRLRESCGGRVATPSEKQKTKQKNTGFTKLSFCVRACPSCSDFHCFRLNSNWYHPSCHGGKKKIRSPPFTPNDTLSFVPLDICREIFFCLPAKSLIRFRAVCFAWRAILDDPGFVKAYTNKSPPSSSNNQIIIRSSTGPPFYPLYFLDLDDLDFTDGLQRIAVTPRELQHPWDFPVAACNGLMLIPCENTYEIWNPLTRECLKLPQANIKSHNKVGTGLGYDFASDDYKAVVIHLLYHSHNDRCTTQTHVYSLRTDSWRNIGNCQWNPEGLGVFFCGSLHWISRAAWKVDSTILSLDLGTESYRQMQMPPPLRKRRLLNRERYYLGVLGDCLILSDHCDTHFVVWVMKGYGDEDYSWVELFSIHTKGYIFGTNLRPVAYMKDKTQVFLQDDKFGFYMFDLERNSIKKVCIHGFLGNSYAQFIPGTIFLLHDNCGATGRRRRRSIMRRERKKKLSNTELYFCVRDGESWGFSHDVCHSLDPNWDHLSSEDEEDL